jgi:uncharacterized delta-60 repeat protein
MKKFQQRKPTFAPIVLSAITFLSISNAHADGQLDTRFATTGHMLVDVSSGAKDVGAVMRIQPDGKILMAGTCYKSETLGSNTDLFPKFCATRLNANGSYDTGFGPGGVGYLRFDRFEDSGGWPHNSFLNDAIRLADGRIALVGLPTDGSAIIIGVLTPDGSTLDPGTAAGAGFFTWKYNGGDSTATSIWQQPDGKILVAGSTTGPNGNLDMAIKRFLPDFSVDTSFGNGGYQTVAFDLGGPSGDNTDLVNSIAVQKDGSILLVGGSTTTSGTQASMTIARLLPNGQLDSSFGPNHDGRVHFAPTAFSLLEGVAVDRQGRIGIVGVAYANISDTAPRCYMNRLLGDGSQDPDFNALAGPGSGQPQLFLASPIGGFHLGCALTNVTVQNDSSLIAVGIAIRDMTGATSYFTTVKLRPDGSFDPGFGVSGQMFNTFAASTSASSIDNGWSISIANGGSMIGGFSTNAAGTDVKFGVARVTLNGIFVGTFDD